MQRFAVFIDAAYVFAQGGAALAGCRQERTDLFLDAPSAVSELKFIAASRAPNSSLLRIYWYDGAGAGGHFTSDQALLARSDDVKVRLGFVNTFGQQKGIASLIASDLIELARHRAIHDAVLLSGEDDMRVGVQIAQSYGVRVHLLSIAPNRAAGLHYDSDTVMDLRRESIERFLSVRRGGANGCALVAQMHAGGGVADFPLTDPSDWEPRLEAVAKEFSETLDDNDLDALDAYWATSRGVPSELDRRLLPFARAAIGRDLDQPEKRFVRGCFQKHVMQRLEEDYEEVD